MTPRPSSLRFLLCTVTVLTLAACTSATPEPPPPIASTTTSTSPPSPPTSTTNPTTQRSTTAQAVRIRIPSGGSFRVHGGYPRVASRCHHPEQPTLNARYPGALLARRAADGTISVTVTLLFESYLDGIAEVPPTWPKAALEAQAIAARSYALSTTGWDGAQGATLPTPICSTTSCQVYGGIPVTPVPGIRRWYAAVRRTSGQVLLYGGRPADTVYFSTSNGHTYGNDVVFGSAPLPYLRPVVERDDGASPTARWRVRLPFVDLARFLHAAGDWAGGRAISGVHSDGSSVVVTGGGGSRSLDVPTFMGDVNTWAPCLEPSRYPTGPLPTTIPSKWFTTSSGTHAVDVAGRGWGHGVGMVQWGAYGKARRGLSSSQILAYYYGGLRPARYPEPGMIHVQVATGLTSLRILPSRAGAVLDGRPVGAGPIIVAAGDQLRVTTRTS